MSENNIEIKDARKRSPWRDVWYSLRRNKSALFGMGIIFLLFFFAITADFIAPYGIDEQNLALGVLKPGSGYPMGTDNLGRDIMSRIIHGSRVSLMVGFVSVSISLLVGGSLGAIAGFFGGKLDNTIMRIMDVLLAIPSILLAISIVSALGPGLVNVMIAVGISSIPSYARIVRASVITLKDQEFIEAAKAVGTSNFRIIAKHLIPNSLAPIIVQATLGVAGAILSAAGLSFIGLGIQPPTPEWGAMLSTGRQYIRDYPHITAFPGLAIMITIFGLNLFGDGLRDALDPRLKN